MADTVPTPQQPQTGNLNPVAAPVQNPQPAPSVQDQAMQQGQQAVQQAQQAMGKATEAMGTVRQSGQQMAQGAQQVMGQAGQVADQASMLMGQAAQLINAKPSQPQPPVTQEEKIWGALSYVPMVALVAFLIKPRSEFVKLHGRQGLLIFIIFFLSIFLYIILPPLGPLLGGLVQLAMFVIGIFSIYQAILGNWWKTPVLGNIADLLPIDMFTNVATQAITGQEPVQNQPVEGQLPVDQSPTAQQNQNPPAGSAPIQQ